MSDGWHQSETITTTYKSYMPKRNRKIGMYMIKNRQSKKSARRKLMRYRHKAEDLLMKKEFREKNLKKNLKNCIISND